MGNTLKRQRLPLDARAFHVDFEDRFARSFEELNPDRMGAGCKLRLAAEAEQAVVAVVVDDQFLVNQQFAAIVRVDMKSVLAGTIDLEITLEQHRPMVGPELAGFDIQIRRKAVKHRLERAKVGYSSPTPLVKAIAQPAALSDWLVRMSRRRRALSSFIRETVDRC